MAAINLASSPHNDLTPHHTDKKGVFVRSVTVCYQEKLQIFKKRSEPLHPKSAEYRTVFLTNTEFACFEHYRILSINVKIAFSIYT